MKKLNAGKSTVALVLVLVVLAERLLFDLGPNIELVTAATFIAGIYLGFPYALIVPFASMALSDTVLGNSSIFWFTWSAYAAISFLPLAFSKWSKKRTTRVLVGSLAYALLSSSFFFIWTNFGVWLQGWYPHSFQGLTTCYVMAIPFLKLNLYSNLLLVPSSVVAIEALKSAFVYSRALITKISKVEV